MNLSKSGLKLNRAVFMFFYLLFLIFFTANSASCETIDFKKADAYSCYGRCEDAKLVLSITKNQDIQKLAQDVINNCQDISQQPLS